MQNKERFLVDSIPIILTVTHIYIYLSSSYGDFDVLEEPVLEGFGAAYSLIWNPLQHVTDQIGGILNVLVVV